ncbi:unnamed protein product [Acanthoscelides obtectus]|uniref:Uncharacterized protein n=1 Tax=Acanthoscelides obtectus TaxID=200917 RepID=A0A9P0JP44_ACAOB|nr:unnamed protein product [Acanthoscelides obtectus]CAK1673679.1 hypothetical protein AOBTE_LOCUS29413 [Acanthoscelides obtectus]
MTWYFIDQHDQRYVGNYDLGELKTDEFYLDVTFSSFHEEVFMYYLNEQCVGCPYLLKPFTNATPLATNLKLKLAKTYQNLLPQDETGDVVCNLDYPFGQFGVYRVKNGSDGCEINVVKEAVNIYTPIITVIAIYAILIIFGYLTINLWKKYMYNKEDDIENKEKGSTKSRIHSLDTFRG